MAQVARDQARRCRSRSVVDVRSTTDGASPSMTRNPVRGAEIVRSRGTGWSTTTIAAGDVLSFNVDSATTITKATLTLKILK